MSERGIDGPWAFPAIMILLLAATCIVVGYVMLCIAFPVMLWTLPLIGAVAVAWAVWYLFFPERRY